jgi:hypothetical protein
MTQKTKPIQKKKHKKNKGLGSLTNIENKTHQPKKKKKTQRSGQFN